MNRTWRSTSPNEAMLEEWVALLKAVKENDTETVHNWLETKGLSPNFVYEGQSPICQAANGGFEDIVDLLIQYQCDPLQPDLSDHMWLRRPIHIAASKGHIGVVKRLLHRGVDVDSRDSDHRTPLHWVSTYGHLELVEYLLSSGASVNIAQVDGFTPLHAATCLGHVDVCQLLIEHGADVNGADRDGWTALHTAACYGYEEVVRVLLDASAKIEQKTNDQESSLHIAVSTNHLDIAKLLCERGASLNAKNMNGYTPFHLAIYYNNLNKHQIVQYLIGIGVQMMTKNYAQQSPLYLAAVRGEDSIVWLMIDGGYDVSQEDWLRADSLPSDMQDTDLGMVLKHLASNPRTLKEIACFALRRFLSGNISEAVKCLPLPESLKQFVCFDKNNRDHQKLSSLSTVSTV